MMNDLANLQRRILAELEEAGSADFCTLINVVAVTDGHLSEVEKMRDALVGLEAKGLVEISTQYDRSIWKRIRLPHDQALKVLHGLVEKTRWEVDEDDGEGYWRWPEGETSPEICLSDRGTKAARDILAQEGYPQSKLESFD